jgi:diacylglycerol kinase
MSWTPPATEHPIEGSAGRPRSRRRWPAKFADAFRGVKLGVRGHSSFFVHFFFATLVVAAAVAFRCDVVDWCLLLGCIGLVLTAELFNSSLETLFHGLDEATKNRLTGVLDISAGAVLLASLTAALIGGIVFLKRLAAMMWAAAS